MSTQPHAGRGRAILIVLGVLAFLATISAWSGVPLKELLRWR